MRLYCIDFMLLFIHCLPFWLDQGVVGTCFIYGFVGVAFHLVRHPGRHWEKKQTTWNNHHSITTTFKKRVPPISNQSWSKISLTFPTKKNTTTTNKTPSPETKDPPRHHPTPWGDTPNRWTCPSDCEQSPPPPGWRYEGKIPKGALVGCGQRSLKLNIVLSRF